MWNLAMWMLALSPPCESAKLVSVHADSYFATTYELEAESGERFFVRIDTADSTYYRHK